MCGGTRIEEKIKISKKEQGKSGHGESQQQHSEALKVYKETHQN